MLEENGNEKRSEKVIGWQETGSESENEDKEGLKCCYDNKVEAGMEGGSEDALAQNRNERNDRECDFVTRD